MTVNFDTIKSPRILCIPYDDPNPASNPDACYAKIGYLDFTNISNPQYYITSISGSAYSGTFNSTANSTIYLCNGAGVTLTTDVPSEASGTSGNYLLAWQTSSDTLSWITNASQPANTSDTYIRTCDSYLSSNTDIINTTPWVQIIHSNITLVAAPIAGTTTNVTSTSFTANWTPSTTVDNTGGGLTIKQFLGYSTDPTMSTGVTWVDVSGLSTYNVTGLTNAQNYYWSVLAQSYNTNTNEANPATNNNNWSCGVRSSTNIVTVNTCISPAITTQPLGNTQCEGTDISFNVVASGTAVLSYQWGKDGSDLLNATNTVYTINNISSVNAGNYICKVTNSCGSITSSPATLTVNLIPGITGTTPGFKMRCRYSELGALLLLVLYNWYAVATGGASLATGTIVTTPVLSSTTTYYVDATSNGCTTVSRTPVTATVNTTPVITGTTDASRCDAGTVNLGATASAGTINWYDVATGGASMATGTTVTTPILSSTTTYYVDATSNGCTTVSRTPVTATVNTTPVITGTTDASRCNAGTVNLGAAASAGTINWYDVATGGASMATGTIITTPVLSSTTTYYVDATSIGCTTVNRSPVTATINPLPVSYSVTGGGSYCSGGSGVFVGLSGSQSFVSYQLLNNGVNTGVYLFWHRLSYQLWCSNICRLFLCDSYKCFNFML